MIATTFRKRDTFLPFSPPNISEDEIEEVVKVLRSPWITTGPKTKQFESEFASFVGAEAALAVNSCTAALHIALAAHGIGPGDEVITTPITFCSTCHVIEHVGATTVLVDVDPETLLMDLNQVAQAITPRTKAIMPVHYSGMPVDMDAMEQIIGDRDIKIIEDAAHCLPTDVRGRPVGSRSNFAAFSFYATKNMTTAEGGMLTGSKELIDQARIWALHGMSRDAFKRYEKGGSWRYEVLAPGFKYNMTDLAASLGLVQMNRLKEFSEHRQKVVARYNEAFRHTLALQTPSDSKIGTHGWHLYVLRVNQSRLSISRDQLIEELAERNIGTSVHFIPIYLHPYYRDKYGWKESDFPVATREFDRYLSLPLSNSITMDDVESVIDAVFDIVDTYSK